MKFYIASKLENAEAVSKLASLLKRRGWVQTYDWTKHGSVQGCSMGRIKEVAELELKGVIDADIVIVMLPGGNGTHAELGAANALGKKVFLYDPTGEHLAGAQNGRTCTFYWNSNITQVTGDPFFLVNMLLDYGEDFEMVKMLQYKFNV